MGQKRFGRLDIEIPPNTNDTEVVAELIGLRYLLIEKEIFGNQAAGNGLTLQVTKGAIRKVLKGQSSKKHLVPYAQFLRTRYVDADIEVSKPNAEQLERWSAIKVAENVPYCVGDHGNVVDTLAIGPVEITAHAVERYAERLLDGDVKRIWRSLIQRLQHAGLVDADLPARVRAHKLKKYADRPGQRIVKHPDGTMHFVLVPNGQGEMTLVTVFELEGTQRHVYGAS